MMFVSLSPDLTGMLLILANERAVQPILGLQRGGLSPHFVWSKPLEMKNPVAWSFHTAPPGSSLLLLLAVTRISLR